MWVGPVTSCAWFNNYGGGNNVQRNNSSSSILPFFQAKDRPDGSKIYVQDLIWDDRAHIADAILNGKGYIYICGDAKSMAKQVEDALARILGEAKGGSSEVEGAAELKLLKERSRYMLDVWS